MIKNRLSVEMNNLAKQIERVIKEGDLVSKGKVAMGKVKRPNEIVLQVYDPRKVNSLYSAFHALSTGDMLTFQVNNEGIITQDPSKVDDGKRPTAAIARNVEETLYSMGVKYDQREGKYLV